MHKASPMPKDCEMLHRNLYVKKLGSLGANKTVSKIKSLQINAKIDSEIIAIPERIKCHLNTSR